MPFVLGSVITNVTNSASSYVANINWGQPTWDLFIVLFFIIAGFLYGLSLGRDRIIVIIISIYMTLAVINTPPVMTILHGLTMWKMSTFLVVFILLFFLLSRSALMKTFGAEAQGSWWQVILFSVVHVGLLVSVVLSFLPVEAVAKLSPLTRTLFVYDYARFAWIVGPIILLIFLKSKEKKVRYDI